MGFIHFYASPHLPILLHVAQPIISDNRENKLKLTVAVS